MDEAETTSQARARTWSSEADKGYDRTKAKAHPQAEHWTREILQLFKHIAWCASAEYRYRSERSHELNAKSEKKKEWPWTHRPARISILHTLRNPPILPLPYVSYCCTRYDTWFNQDQQSYSYAKWGPTPYRLSHVHPPDTKKQKRVYIRRQIF